MLDIKFVRENPEAVKENIRKKFQDAKLPMVDEVIALDKQLRETKQEVERLLNLGASRKQWNYPKDADYVVLQDPDGNPFCVVQI